VDIAAIIITSGFANNTTLRDLEFEGWREADLASVLTVLQKHSALQKINLTGTPVVKPLWSLSGIEVLLCRHDSKANELVLEQINARAVGLHQVIRELGCNTTVTNLAIRGSVLSRESVQQLKSMLRRNAAPESLDLTSNVLRSAGLVEIAPVLYRNTSIKTLDLANNGLDDIDSTNILRELIRRNDRTITTSLCIAHECLWKQCCRC
jgi:hypothetical protein